MVSNKSSLPVRHGHFLIIWIPIESLSVELKWFRCPRASTERKAMARGEAGVRGNGWGKAEGKAAVVL